MAGGSGMELVAIEGAERQQQMLDLLREGFPQARFDWAIAFNAPPGRSGYGLLMIVDGHPQGGILCFEKVETFGGRERRIVNVSSWYIRPKYRRMAVRMLRTLTSDPDAVFTACSPIKAAQAIGLRTGFRYLSHGSIASVPLLNGFTAGRGIKVGPFDPDAVGPEHRRWMADHANPRHIALLIRQGERAVPALWRRGLKVKELPAARLIFTSDYALLRAALPAIHAHMLRRHGIVGLYLPRIAPLEGLRSVRKRNKGPSIIVKGDIADEDVNLLYSELSYLPLGDRSAGDSG